MSRALLILALVACALVAAEAQACRDHPDRQCRPRKLCKYGYIRGQCPGITYCCNPAPGSSSSAAPTQSLRPKPRPDSWASNGIPTIDRNGPGVKSPVMVTVSQEAIHYFEDTLLPMVLKGKKIVGKNFIEGKPIEKEIKILFWKRIAKIDLIRCESLDYDSRKTKIMFNQAARGLDITIADLTLSAYSEIKLFKKNGKFDRTHKVSVFVKKANLEVSARLGNNNGVLTAVFTKGDLVIPKNGLDIQLRTQVGDKKRKRRFLNWIINLFENMLAKLVSKQVAKNLAGINKGIKKALEKIPRKHQIKPVKGLNMPHPIDILSGLHSAPTVTSDALTLLLNGQVSFNGRVCKACPMAPKPSNSGNRHVEVDIGEHVPCCAINALHAMGALNFRGIIKTPEVKPGGDKVKLAVKGLVDAVFGKFSLGWQAVAVEAPKLRFTKQGLFIEAHYDGSLFLLTGNSWEAKRRELIKFTLQARANANVDLKEGVIRGVIPSAPQVKVSNLNILGKGSLNQEIHTELNAFASEVIADIVMPKLNEQLEKSASWAIQGTADFTPTNSHAKIGDGFITVATDVKLHLSDETMAKMVMEMEME
eukprot:TRINITY_DN572_c2_g1_i1.p1 TRINITY_DN572_c2_g1~~TRINITY_DN572_c2_g1_i1.p1  ORF type:complete len:591 (-),score=197.36 TRINITY_DN572_c2_g1_i1:260-2032(-)